MAPSSTQVTSAKRRRVMTPEQRQRDIERQRRFRQEHPDKCREYRRRWLEKQVAKRAAALIAEAEASERGGGRDE